MIQRGLRTGDLARMIDVTPNALKSAICKNCPGPQMRSKIEMALGWVPVWGDSRTVELRRQCAERIGFDPGSLFRDDLRERIRVLPVSARRGETYEEMIEAIIQFVAANPSFTVKPS